MIAGLRDCEPFYLKFMFMYVITIKCSNLEELMREYSRDTLNVKSSLNLILP